MSKVTPILTGLMDLKRNTSYLLDSTAIAASLSASRQPQKQVRLEVEVVGSSVSDGVVTVFESNPTGVDNYVIADRSTGIKYAITISSGIATLVQTTASASAEPIFLDTSIPQYWRLFVDNGEFGVETIFIIQNDVILLNDSVTSQTYKLAVNDGTFGIILQDSPGVTEYVLTDRSLPQKYAICVNGGTLQWSPTTSIASSEIIVKDTLNSSNYWKIFMDNGQVSVEYTSTLQDDSVILNDVTGSNAYKIIVSDGLLGLTIQGASSGTNSETFNFSTNDVRRGIVDFLRIGRITTSGFTGGYLIIRALNKLGQPVNQIVNASLSTPVRFYRKRNRIRMEKPGQLNDAEYKVMVEPTLDIRENDLCYPTRGLPGMTLCMINSVTTIYDFAGATHHIEANLYNV